MWALFLLFGVVLAAGPVDGICGANSPPPDAVVVPFEESIRILTKGTFKASCKIRSQTKQGELIQCGTNETLVCVSNQQNQGCYRTGNMYCVDDPCKHGAICAKHPNAICKFDIESMECYSFQLRDKEEGSKDSPASVKTISSDKCSVDCPSNKKFYRKDIPCQKTCDDPTPVCVDSIRSGCGCAADQFWDGTKCLSKCPVICPSNQIYFDYNRPCLNNCTNRDAPCPPDSPKYGCGCDPEMFWDGFECVVGCDWCPPYMTVVPCTSDPCLKKCKNFPLAKCKRLTCGNCSAEYYSEILGYKRTIITASECNADSLKGSGTLHSCKSILASQCKDHQTAIRLAAGVKRCVTNPCLLVEGVYDGVFKARCRKYPYATCKFNISAWECHQFERTVKDEATGESRTQIYTQSDCSPGCPANQVYYRYRDALRRTCDSRRFNNAMPSNCACPPYQQWDGRNCVSKCPVTCPSNKVYFDDGMPCQRTCDNPDRVCPPGEKKHGCGCTSGLYWDGFECVEKCKICKEDEDVVSCGHDACLPKCEKYPLANCTRSMCGKCESTRYVGDKSIPFQECNKECGRKVRLVDMCFCDGTCHETPKDCNGCLDGACDCVITYKIKTMEWQDPLGRCAQSADICKAVYDCNPNDK